MNFHKKQSITINFLNSKGLSLDDTDARHPHQKTKYIFSARNILIAVVLFIVSFIVTSIVIINSGNKQGQNASNHSKNAISSQESNPSNNGNFSNPTNSQLPNEIVSKTDVSTPSPITTPQNTPSPSPVLNENPSSIIAEYAIQDQWNDGANINITIHNKGQETISGWSLEFNFPNGQKILNAWGGIWNQNNAYVSINSLNWNQNIAPNSSIQVGFSIKISGANPKPSILTFNHVDYPVN